MILAHAFNQDGPHVEVLIVAAALFLLGVIFFVQKSVKPVISVSLVAVSVAMTMGAFALVPDKQESQGRRVVVREPKPGDVVEAGKPFRMDVAVLGAKLASGSDTTDGSHLHVLVDGAVIDLSVTTTTPRVKPLEPGEHELAIELVDPQHLSFEPKVIDSIEIRAE